MKFGTFALMFIAVAAGAIAGCAEKNSVPPRDQYTPVDQMNDTSRRAINSPYQR